MDATPFDKKRLPSRHLTKGPERAPHRFFYHAMGLTDEPINTPFIGMAFYRDEPAPASIAVRTHQHASGGASGVCGTPLKSCRINGEDVTVVDTFDAIGQQSPGDISDTDLHELECAAYSGVPMRGREFTASTVTCGSEAIASVFPGAVNQPAPYESRDRFAYGSEWAVVQPDIAALKPGGRFVAKDIYEGISTVDGRLSRTALIMDGRLSGVTRGFCIGHAFPDAAVGGLIAPVKDSETISIDADSGRRDLKVGEDGQRRRESSKPPHNFCQSGVLWKYDQSVGSARKGAVTYPGARQEIVCYADQ